MTSLPSLDECGLDETGRSIWRKLLEAEKTALEYIRSNKAKYNDPVIGIRILGFFLKDFRAHTLGYGSAPYARLCREITSCFNKSDDKAIYDALVELGLRYRNYLLRVFRSNTGGRPTPSRHVSRPSFDVVKERILEELGKAPQTKKSVRKQALLRDGYRCAITGVYDVQSCIDIDEIEAVADRGGSITLETEVAHIFSESAQDGDKEYAATVLAMLEMFGLGEKAKSLYGGQVNSLHNVITMEHNLHAAFDSFNLWLEPVAEHENTYKVCWNPRRLKRFSLPIPSRITFSVDPAAAAAAEAVNKELMLPDRSLIAIRAACARVANLSGAAEQADQILRDLEDTTVLADDGSMAGLLSSRLSMLTSRFAYVHGNDVPAAQLMT
ncbi:hypothetical protein D9756_003616 [Leucocoprinus leucothites]|uniref:HNH nuclease domain-containing protein n=1 Tax=Leucocoprinus leucothites TaxID=201217 RepID=A0A8H5G7M1_9AGAR|nr:hypothetical protein D9756_003616 [Leucoagaricus leucothites]